MKVKHIVAALALFIPGFMAAVSADPRPRIVYNPDGSTATVRVHGNEFFHFMTDIDCTRILERDSRGFIVDAVRNGVTLSCSGENIRMLKAEAEPDSPATRSAEASSIRRMGTLDAEGRSTYPTIGKGNRSLVVLVEFKDTPFTVENPKEYYTRQLNERGFSEYGASGSALDYYLDASNGLYSPQFDVYGPVKVSENASFFQGMGDGSLEILIRESLTQLHDSGEVDFSNYDLDEDGIVDTVFFYYAGYGSADSETETIWPHQFDYRFLGSDFGTTNLRLDGKRIGPYACANELKGWNPMTQKNPWRDGSEPWVDGIGTFVHEYGHVLGLPDLYDVDYTEGVYVDTPGDWDVMDSGSYNFNGCLPPLMSAYEQWVCRWLEYTDAEDATHYDIKAIGNTDSPTAVRIRIPASEEEGDYVSEYFLVEARDNSKWDACFPQSGLLVWRINYSKNNWLNNSVNSVKGSNVKIVYARSQRFPVFTEGSIYSGSDVELVPTRKYPYWRSPAITDISYDASSQTGSFDYNMVVQSDVYTVLHDAPEAAPDGSRAFCLTWDPVDGVDSYQVTVRIQSTGRVIDDFDAKDVGKDTSVWVSGLSSTYWRLQMEAFVKCVVGGIPSSANSNTVVFKPSELSLGNNAVDGVGEDAVVVSGGVGCVNAPEGAEVYDMSGKRLSKERLAAGIYLVVYGGASYKVIVR